MSLFFLESNPVEGAGVASNSAACPVGFGVGGNVKFGFATAGLAKLLMSLSGGAEAPVAAAEELAVAVSGTAG